MAPFFGATVNLNTFLLERYMLHTDWHMGKHLSSAFDLVQERIRVFQGRGGPRPIDEKKLDFEAAYLEVGRSDKKNWVVLRVGRQELKYGSGRLVSIREGPNVRQSFRRTQNPKQKSAHGTSTHSQFVRILR